MSLFIANNKMMSINGTPLMLPEIEAFTFKIDTTKGNGFPSFKIPTLAGTVNNFSYRVDYTGAWTPITAWDQPETLITFPSAGIYTIEVRGTVGAWNDNNTGDVQKYVEHLSFGDTIFNSISGMYYGAINLKFAGSSTNKLVKKGPNAPKARNVDEFCRASGINYIPDELFYRIPKLVSISSALRDCLSLTGSVPVNILRYVPDVTTILYFMAGCPNITGSIPTDILRYVPKLTNLTGFFFDCSGLTGVIPTDILRYVPNITTLPYFLYNCSGLSGNIPTEILSYIPNVTSLTNFLYGCSNLTGAIPTDILRYVSLVTVIDNFLRGCSKLSGSIPTDILRYVINITSLNGFLFGCGGLTGTIQSNILEYLPNVTILTGFLYGCIGLSGTAPSIKYCKNVTSLSSFLYGMRNLTIPSDMFDLPSINNVTNWNNCLMVTSTAFSHTGTLQPIWDYELETATGKSTAFLNCTALTNYGQLRIEWP